MIDGEQRRKKRIKRVHRVRAGLTDAAGIERNLWMHCIPDGLFEGRDMKYEDFLAGRRVLMARRVREYFGRL